MKTLLLFALSAGLGAALQGQDPVPPSQNQATKPAKPPEVMPAPAEAKQVEVPVTDASSFKDKAPAAGVDSKQTEKGRRAAYVLGPEDVLMIRVWEQPNLSGQVTVGPDGMISLQLIDEVKAEGLTPEQLKKSLTEKLKAFMVTPDVNVQLVRGNSRKYIIQGEVNRPGSYSLIGQTNVMEALVNAVGFREFANTKKIYILRTVVDPVTQKPETKKFLFNYKDVSHGRHMEQNILVLPGDQIYVP